jgi:hypothetical protein
MLGTAAAMESDANSGAVTVKVALLELIAFADAVMDVMPCARAAASPLLFNVATLVSLDAQSTEPEISPVLASEKVPVAVKVTGTPLGVDGVAGLIAIAVIAAAVTVNVALAEVMPLAVAVTDVSPSVFVAATPLAFIVATVVLLDDQFAAPEMLAAVPSE